jgi:hypothetical protein
VNKELYKAKVREFCSLMNVSDLSTKPTAQAIFDKIDGRFTDDDMVNSFNDMMEAEVIKLTYPILMRYLRKYKEVRVGVELQRRKLQERNEVEQVLTHAEIRKLIDSIIHKTPGAGHDYLRANATIWRKNGSPLAVYIDPTDPNLEHGKAVTIVYEQHGEQMVRASHIRLGMVRHKILTKRTDGPPVRRGPQSMFAPPPPEDDFIPELEVE